MEGWIQTFTGCAVDPLDPLPESLVIEDIAHALSLVNRYTGHTFEPYSVALHSLAVMKLAERRGYSKQTQLWALLHDATEAYLADIAAPVKQHSIFKEYRIAEQNLERVVRERFMPGALGLKLAEVKAADWDVLLAERNEVLPEGKWEATNPPDDAVEAFEWVNNQLGWQSPKGVERAFLAAFDRLGGVR